MHITKANDATKKLLELINLIKLQYTINIQKSVPFLYVNIHLYELEIKKAIPFIKAMNTKQ
jgi:hypothetical protein